MKFVINLLSLESGKLLKAHIKNGLRLKLGKSESSHKRRARFVNVF